MGFKGEGAPVECAGEAKGVVYRYTGGALRYYPSVSVASSWDADWRAAVEKIDCSDISKGPVMKLKGKGKNIATKGKKDSVQKNEKEKGKEKDQGKRKEKEEKEKEKEKESRK